LNIVAKQSEDRLRACFAENSQLLLPMLDLIQNTRTSIDELMYDAGRSLVEQLLVISATEVAGDKHPGRKGGEIRWHGSQRGQIVMDGRNLNIERPRQRRRGGGEVPTPAYEQLNENPRLAERVHDIMVTLEHTAFFDHAAERQCCNNQPDRIEHAFHAAARHQQVELGIACRRLVAARECKPYAAGFLADRSVRAGQASDRSRAGAGLCQ